MLPQVAETFGPDGAGFLFIYFRWPGIDLVVDEPVEPGEPIRRLAAGVSLVCVECGATAPPGAESGA